MERSVLSVDYVPIQDPIMESTHARQTNNSSKEHFMINKFILSVTSSVLQGLGAGVNIAG